MSIMVVLLRHLIKGLRDIGNPVDLAMYYNEAGADELVFLDISKERKRVIA
ncbi:HisA/HisF-related TIM barrel protein [Staphylococcus aureus]